MNHNLIIIMRKKLYSKEIAKLKEMPTLSTREQKHSIKTKEYNQLIVDLPRRLMKQQYLEHYSTASNVKYFMITWYKWLEIVQSHCLLVTIYDSFSQTLLPPLNHKIMQFTLTVLLHNVLTTTSEHNGFDSLLTTLMVTSNFIKIS